jgi:hypothetical protein
VQKILTVDEKLYVEIMRNMTSDKQQNVRSMPDATVWVSNVKMSAQARPRS